MTFVVTDVTIKPMVKKDLMIRLIKYKRVLIQFKTMGLERVFSNNLGDAVGVSAALVRKDLSAIESQGNRRGGYNIDSLLARLNCLLGSGDNQKVIIVGCGNLGKALINHKPFFSEGISIAAGFDIAPQTDSISGIPVYSTGELEEYINKNNIKVALMTVPASSAAETKNRLLKAGIRGILNFTPMELRCTGKCIIHNVNIGLEIENLFFQVNSVLDREAKGEDFFPGCCEEGCCGDETAEK